MENEFSIASAFGRFHPVLVHLPIGILILAFVFELLSRTQRFRKLKASVQLALFCGMLAALLTAGSGYYLSMEGGYDENLLSRHQLMGFLTAGLSIIIYLFKRNLFSLEKRERKMAVLVLFFPLMILLVVTGHLGGSITHGEDFLFKSNPREVVEKPEIPEALSATSVEEVMVYENLVRPLMSARCYQCHGAKKQKGQLRLDREDYILKGGKNGKIMDAGDPAKSELYARISRSIEEKGHMPPRKETQLSAAEIELLRWWIEQGASFTKKVGELPRNPELEAFFVSGRSEKAVANWFPEEDVEAADESVVSKIRSMGISVVRLANNSHYMSVSFAGKNEAGNEALQSLAPITPQLVDLNLAWTSVTDSSMRVISGLKELRRLNLASTKITDAGLRELKFLNKLTYLNLVGTAITDKSIETLSQMKALREVYVFDTGITGSALRKSKGSFELDTGSYQLPFRVTDTLVYTRRK